MTVFSFLFTAFDMLLPFLPTVVFALVWPKQCLDSILINTMLYVLHAPVRFGQKVPVWLVYISLKFILQVVHHWVHISCSCFVWAGRWLLRTFFVLFWFGGGPAVYYNWLSFDSERFPMYLHPLFCQRSMFIDICCCLSCSILPNHLKK